MVPGINFINNHTLFGLVPLRNGLLLWIFLDVVIDYPGSGVLRPSPGAPSPKGHLVFLCGGTADPL